jgi:Protein of unknown function (DUF3105)
MFVQRVGMFLLIVYRIGSAMRADQVLPADDGRLSTGTHAERSPPARATARPPAAGRNPMSKRSLQAATIAAVGVLVAGGNVAAYADAAHGREPHIAGVRTFHDLSRRHTTAHVAYPQVPPVGGPHAPRPLNCGVYSTPVRQENAVHSLEHGAVWITYRPDLPDDQVATLRALVHGRGHLLLSPYPGLPAPVVASAWGRQLRLGDAYDPRLNSFVGVFREGPQTPERGAPCSGGVGHPS